MIEIPVQLPGTAYPVQIGAGILADLPETLDAHCPAPVYALITDSNVAEHYLGTVQRLVERVGPCRALQFPSGEANKTRETWSTLSDGMLEAGVGRDGAVIALGGGVVGDLAGFVAATYHRGVDLVQIPTSLVAMVDSSVGGKTGVDTPVGKNLVGAFHQPKLVLADVDTLKTLPEREFVSGLAETLKHGAITDREYFDWIVDHDAPIRARGSDELTYLVSRSVGIKGGVVTSDEREAGQRATLNFGHTIGHAIEASLSYRLLHGEAIAIGMVAEAVAGEIMGITAEGSAEVLRGALQGCGLPVTLPDSSRSEDVLEAAMSDKKNRRGRVRFAPIERIGKSARTETGNWTFELEVTTMEAGLRAVRS